MKILSCMLLALLGLAFSTQESSAQPQGRFAVAWIQNDLVKPSTVYYKWVWPNGQVASDWQRTIIPPNQNVYFSWEYDGATPNSPNLFVRFDTDRRQDGVLYWEYRLGRGQSPDSGDLNYGARYSIHYVNSANKRFAELIPINNIANMAITDRQSQRPF